MLILTRRVGESVMIGDEMKVTVLEVKGSQIKLGFAAPADIAIHLEEIYNRIQDEKNNKKAIKGQGEQGDAS